jgi:hypothetical protein
LLLSCVATAGALAAVASTRNIGELSNTPTGCDSTTWIQSSSHAGSTYVVPAGTWVIDRWTIDNFETGSASLLALRPVGGGYRVVGVSHTESISNPGVFSFATSLPVRNGDVIGFWVNVRISCAATTPNVDDVVQMQPYGTAKPAVGTLIASGSLTAVPGFRLDVVAHLSTPGDESGRHIAYCLPMPVARADGTTGTFVDLVAGQPAADPRYAGAVTASYGQGYGLTCDNLAARGYTDAGYDVDGSGGANSAPALTVYEYFTK